jgi:hypothetical protein
LYLACRNIGSLIQPATSIVLQTFICLNIYKKKKKPAKKECRIIGSPGLQGFRVLNEIVKFNKPSRKQISGSVVSSNPEHTAFSTELFSSLPKVKVQK